MNRNSVLFLTVSLLISTPAFAGEGAEELRAQAASHSKAADATRQVNAPLIAKGHVTATTAQEKKAAVALAAAEQKEGEVTKYANEISKTDKETGRARMKPADKK